jgi:thiamine kinase-like enzyme
MLKYRSNDNDVLDFQVCDDIVSSIKYKLIEKLYYNKNSKFRYLSDTPAAEISALGRGGEGKVYLVQNKECGSIVIKISKGNDNESKISKYCKEIVDKYICPNLLYFYGVKHVKKYNITMSEYADGTLEDWLETKHTYEEWRTFMFQFLVGVLCIQIKLKAYHNDLKPKNILFKKLSIPNIVFLYKIQEKQYMVPTTGNLFVIADFGKIQSLLLRQNEMDKNSIELFIKNNLDLEHIIDLPKRIIVSGIEAVYSFDELIDTIRTHNDTYFDNYLQNKRDEINEQLRKYPDYVKNKMLYRSVAYYAVEKNYIDWKDLPTDSLKMKPPPKQIIDQLNQWKDSNKKITDILDTFTEYQTNVQSYTDQHVVTFSLY